MDPVVLSSVSVSLAARHEWMIWEDDFHDSDLLLKDRHLITTKIESEWNLMYYTPRISHRWGRQFCLKPDYPCLESPLQLLQARIRWWPV
jgi:hypothetical protein